MTVVESLNALKEFVENKVASSILLPKEGLATEKMELVNPYVALIAMPHKNFTPVNFQVPHILIGFATGTDGANEHSVNIQMQFATFGGDIKFKETANIPDSSGYIDLLNLIERTKKELIQEAVIKGGVVSKPMMYGIYNEQITYPYWYGYLTFELQIQTTLRQMKEFL